MSNKQGSNRPVKVCLFRKENIQGTKLCRHKPNSQAPKKSKSKLLLLHTIFLERMFGRSHVNRIIGQFFVLYVPCQQFFRRICGLRDLYIL